MKDNIMTAREGHSFFFVYGTLMNYTSLMYNLTVGEAVLVAEEAYINGTMYDLGWYPGVKVTGAEDRKGLIKGQVFEVPNKHIFALDRYEGEGSLYSRITITAQSNDFYLSCYTYEYQGRVTPSMKIEDNDWLAHESNKSGSMMY